MKSVLLSFLFLIFILAAQAQTTKPPFKIVGYYSLKAATTDWKDAPFKHVTHLNLWFLNPDSLGNFTRDLSALKPFVDAAHRKHVKVLISIGGGTRQPQYHKLLRPEHRTRLINNLMAEVKKYDVDGLDIDLEGTDIDEHYEDFVIELGSALHGEGKLITAAVAIYYKDQFTDKALAQYDFVNVMSYDRTGPWRPDRPGPHATYANAEEDLDYFGVTRHISPDRMTLGVPFYGYGFGPELTSPAVTLSYKDIVAKFPGSETTDELKMGDGKTLYYNGVPTLLRKTALAKTKASGIMIWELRGDAAGAASVLKRIHKASKSRR